MGRFVRFVVVASAFALAGIPFVASSAGAQVETDLTIVVRKVVTGAGTGPSTVSMTCETIKGTVLFNFDAQGSPTTTNGGGSIVGGAWQMTGASGNGDTCQFSETTTGGATSTSWTCTYTSTARPAPTAESVTPPGCSAASGTGTGPATVVYAADTAITQQSSDVTFTNTFPAAPTTTTTTTPLEVAPAVVVTPTFTG